jgi:hypothetical protein
MKTKPTINKELTETVTHLLALPESVIFETKRVSWKRETVPGAYRL